MGTNNSCTHAAVEYVTLPAHKTNEVGIPLELIDCVDGTVCKKCGELLSHKIQYPDRLIAAAAVARISEPEKLTGADIRFLRKALQEPAKDIASLLSVAPETVSRWENDKLPMNPQSEKLFRIYVGFSLQDKAPAVRFDAERVVSLELKPVFDGAQRAMTFQLVSIMADNEIEPAFARKLAA